MRLAFLSFLSFSLGLVAPVSARAAGTTLADLYEALLSHDATGASAFVRAHPEWDGRGVVVAVLDTGVDPAVPGLRQTPQGEPKVILVRDFSGQGKLELHEVERAKEDGVDVLRHGDIWVQGFSDLQPAPRGGVEACKLGVIDEANFKNSEVHDLNADGQTGDRFAVLACPVGAGDEDWAFFVDTDGDHDLRDERAIESYERKQEWFALAGADRKKAVAPLHFAFYWDAEGKTLELCFDDGGHGTHVAGIATGWRIDGRDGWNGIAPGAQVLSLKIGNNALAGGATTTESKRKALEFAAKWAEEHDRPVVINLSYGIGSEVEGYSDIDKLVTDVLRKHPTHLFMSTSAGNSGPGLSTVGQPAASALVFTAAAGLTRASAAALFGHDPGADLVFSFSSRGGELDKPSGLLPGVAASTVPPFVHSDVMMGTSMASPQGAGVMALLVGAALAKGLHVNNGMVRRAMRFSARPLSGYTPLDQGGGMVDVPAAWAALQRLAQLGQARAVVGFSIETDVPTAERNVAPAAYWRLGGDVPPPGRDQVFRVVPIFAGEPTKAERRAFFGAYHLAALAPWLDVTPRELALRGEGAAKVHVRFDTRRLREPGLYVGRVLAIPASERRHPELAAFELLATVIRPWRFDASNGYARQWRAHELAPGRLERFFVRIPPGASSWGTKLDVKDGHGWVQLAFFDPQGRRRYFDGDTAETDSGGKARVWVSGEDLVPGVWEVDVYSTFRNPGPIRFDMSMRFFGLDAGDVGALVVSEGQRPEADVDVVNRFDAPFRGAVRGQVDGYSRKDILDADGDTIRYPFDVDASMRRVVFALSLDPDTYARFTDVAVNVLDASGKAVVRWGFDQAKTRLSFDNPRPGRYTLEIRAALTTESDESWSVEMDERYVTRNVVAVTGSIDGDTNVELWPDAPRTVTLKLSRAPAQAPDGYAYRGQVEFVDAKGAVWLRLPLRLQP